MSRYYNRICSHFTIFIKIKQSSDLKRLMTRFRCICSLCAIIIKIIKIARAIGVSISRPLTVRPFLACAQILAEPHFRKRCAHLLPEPAIGTNGKICIFVILAPKLKKQMLHKLNHTWIHMERLHNENHRLRTPNY